MEQSNSAHFIEMFFYVSSFLLQNNEIFNISENKI